MKFVLAMTIDAHCTHDAQVCLHLKAICTDENKMAGMCFGVVQQFSQALCWDPSLILLPLPALWWISDCPGVFASLGSVGAVLEHHAWVGGGE